MVSCPLWLVLMQIPNYLISNLNVSIVIVKSELLHLNPCSNPLDHWYSKLIILPPFPIIINKTILTQALFLLPSANTVFLKFSDLNIAFFERDQNHMPSLPSYLSNLLSSEICGQVLQGSSVALPFSCYPLPCYSLLCTILLCSSKMHFLIFFWSEVYLSFFCFTWPYLHAVYNCICPFQLHCITCKFLDRVFKFKLTIK